MTSILARALRRQTTSVATRSIQTLSFGGTDETIIERSDYPKSKIEELFKDDTVSMLGYGTQGRGQALNARDSGIEMCIGLREGGASWKLAIEDGWVPGESLVSVEEAAARGTVVMYLLSDAGQVRWVASRTLCTLLTPPRRLAAHSVDACDSPTIHIHHPFLKVRCVAHRRAAHHVG